MAFGPSERSDLPMLQIWGPWSPTLWVHISKDADDIGYGVRTDMFPFHCPDFFQWFSFEVFIKNRTNVLPKGICAIFGPWISPFCSFCSEILATLQSINVSDFWFEIQIEKTAWFLIHGKKIQIAVVAGVQAHPICLSDSFYFKGMQTPTHESLWHIWSHIPCMMQNVFHIVEHQMTINNMLVQDFLGLMLSMASSAKGQARPRV